MTKVTATDVPTIIGRDRELAELADALRSASAARSVLVDIVGQQGIGKTATLRWLEATVASTGFVCLTASGFRQESDHPYGALSRMFDGLLGEPTAPSLIDPQDAAALRAALPGFRDDIESSGEAVTQIELLRAVRSALTAAASAHSGLVIILDNIEFVDDLTIAGHRIRLSARSRGATAHRDRDTGRSCRHRTAYRGRALLTRHAAAAGSRDAAHPPGRPPVSGPRTHPRHRQRGTPFRQRSLPRSSGAVPRRRPISKTSRSLRSPVGC